MRKPLNVEKDLMRELGFRHLRDLEKWLNQDPPPEKVERFGEEPQDDQPEEEPVSKA